MEIALKQQKRRWIGFGVTTLILIAAIFYAILLRIHFSEIAFQEGTCTFSQKLHLYCPGCGGTRSIKYLLQGKVFHSLLAHPVPVYALVVLVRIWVALGHNLLVGRKMTGQGVAASSSAGKIWPVFCHWEMWFILVVVFGFFILRDVLLVTLKWDFLGDLAQFW